ncbi:Beta-glucuronosyltransferase GlcAT14C [Vigna angularis]|uniref:Beta-glucuronosyltransferase GlcAT14C n=1 Tax=Phaseolus angularis TaxID=3914 RepID=A0A8T0JVK3_PHAAN|nr:Beta-glucuronosyltransferase GlcAT14C [Vigna angularis]
MKRNHNSHNHHHSFRPRKWMTMIIAIVTICIILLLLTLTKPSSSSSSPSSSSSATWSSSSSSSFNLTEEVGVGLPRLAYMLTGTKGEEAQLKRVLQAVYHPRNFYLLHLDLEASDEERLELAKYVKFETVFAAFGNVMVVGKSDLVTYKGPTMVASTLHGIALLLKRIPHWDWFLNLSASDYPLISQDDLLHIFSFLPRDLNFIEHTSNIGWKEYVHYLSFDIVSICC